MTLISEPYAATITRFFVNDAAKKNTGHLGHAFTREVLDTEGMDGRPFLVNGALHSGLSIPVSAFGVERQEPSPGHG